MSTEQTITHLNGLLADSTVFWYKLRNYHWNVTGPQFFTLHEKFEELYDEWNEVLDEIAERIKQLGGTPLGSLAEVLKHASLSEETRTLDAKSMVKQSLEDINAQRDRMKAVQAAAIEAGDKTTENMIDGFIDAQAKHAWMLGAFVKETVEQD